MKEKALFGALFSALNVKLSTFNGKFHEFSCIYQKKVVILHRILIDNAIIISKHTINASKSNRYYRPFYDECGCISTC